MPVSRALLAGVAVLLLAGRVVAEGPPASVLTAAHLAVAYEGRIVRVGDDTLIVDEARRAPHDATSHQHP